MRAVDTNVLVRLLTRDDARQVVAAEEFIAQGAWVAHIVLVETVWVLTSVYELDASAVATAADCLVVATARAAGHVPLGTFDRALSRLEAVQRL